MRSTHFSIVRAASLVFCATGTLLCASAATAADREPNVQARYQRDRAVCLSGQSHQDRATCMREAAAALKESRLAGLTSGQLEQNRYLRCDPLPVDQKSDCIRRMDGEGITRGSVEEGGIYRELRTMEPAPTSSLSPSLQ